MMHKALKISLIVLGSLIGAAFLFFLILVMMGTQEVKDPFPDKGIEVLDAPFSGSSVTLTWKIHNQNIEATGVYVTSASVPDFPQDVSPANAGYKGTPVPGTLNGDTYSATIPVTGAVVYARVWARADSVDWWSIEYPIVRGAP
jgi:hypothetical protein